jgi:hypothetical protein
MELTSAWERENDGNSWPLASSGVATRAVAPKNDEARMSNDEGMTKFEASLFGFHYWTLFRHSSFGFRHVF